MTTVEILVSGEKFCSKQVPAVGMQRGITTKIHMIDYLPRIPIINDVTNQPRELRFNDFVLLVSVLNFIISGFIK